MSDQDRQDLPPEDPWARWRKPAEKPAVDAEKAPKSDVLSEPVAEQAPTPPLGTLGVRKVVKPETRPEKPHGKGGRRPGEPQEGRPSAARREARPAGKSFADAGERKTERSGGKPAAGQRPVAGPGVPRGDKPAPKFGQPAASTAKMALKPAAKPAAIAAGEAPSGVRLSKVMSERGLCSRREADLWIERGWVFVNGEPISELGSRIDPVAEITVSKEAVRDQAKQVTILLHKPIGYVSGQPEPGCTPAVTLITPEAQVPQSGDPEFKPWMLRGLAPAGRLDVDSTGLLVLTSDGRVAKKLIGEDSDAEKEYLVRVSGQMIKGGLDLLRHGLELDGKPLKPAWVKQLNEDQLHFILKEGKKRQIRRMCELVGLKVIGLKRVRIGRIRLGDLPLGRWRFLRADEAF